MTEVAQANEQQTSPITVGQLGARLCVTARTLHYYDEIGLLAPSGRRVAGYQLYAEADACACSRRFSTAGSR